jgi:hypothetical protein
MTLLIASPCYMAPAWASTGYVDGISDQSLPAWDNNFSGSYFASFLQSNWINPAPHIQYARYVVQWNVMTETSNGPNPNGDYRERFESWLTDIESMGLTIDVGLTSYNGVFPSSSAEYKTRLKEVLREADETLKYPVRYLEAWNEPNGQGKESEVNAAHFTNEAYSACEGASPKCTIIAGNVEDNPSAKAYEEKYRAYLNPVPAVWGIHPYVSVETRKEEHYLEALEGLPNKGIGDQIWFTEVAARKCIKNTDNGELGQAERAGWLVDTLMYKQRPEHAFYWEFLLANRKQPTCGETDDALYVPSGSDPNTEDRPRPAAAFIYGDAGFPWGYIGPASIRIVEPSVILAGSIYPWGFLRSEYQF